MRRADSNERADGARLTVNGASHAVEASEDVALARVLRDELGFTGVRQGCGIGECGACTVLVEGIATRSCITPLGSVRGARVVTPEGLGTPDAPHPVQQAFLEEEAAQCGYCVNGIIMTTAALLQATPEPSEADIQDALVEHICRCGTHSRILRAMRRAAGRPEPRPSGIRASRVAVAGAASVTGLPADVEAHPLVEHWLEIDGSGAVRAYSGKVEIGQGIRQAMAVLVANELGIEPRRVRVVSPSTDRAPDEGYTAGSASIERGGTALAMAAAAARRLLLVRAARALGRPVADLTWDGGEARDRRGRSASLAELARLGPLTGPILATDLPRWSSHDAAPGPAFAPQTAAEPRPRREAVAGTAADAAGSAPASEPGSRRGAPRRSEPRSDLAAKLTGAPAYVHDMTLPGMLHARALLPPSYGARLAELDVREAAAVAGLVTVHRDGNLVLVIAETQDAAERAVTRLARSARWAAAELAGATPDWLQQDADEHVGVASTGEPAAALEGSPRRVAATYGKPYEAHAPLAPSCAVARLHPATATASPAAADDAAGEARPGTLEVWTHSQGIYPLRRELAAALRRSEDSVLVRHGDGPGCYGHNAADDAAGFAAVAAAVTPGRPVRFQFTVEDEFAWEPYGPAMQARLEAALGDGGRVRAWRHAVRTDVHNTRPNGDGDRLVAAWLATGKPMPAWPGAAEAGFRNATPLYAFPATLVEASFKRGPLRVSALRTLGAYLNVFAIESFMDELALEAGADPVAFRLTHLHDPRARAVLEAAVDASGWTPALAPSGQGVGVAVSRYKGAKAYVAAVVTSAMDAATGRIRVDRVVCACDAGYVVDEVGLRNQVEGGALQALSRALYEEVRFGPEGILTRDWTRYPVLRFADVPTVEVVLLDGGGPPLGAGEAATPPVPPALANAVFDATGIRLRELPLTEARVRRRLMDLSEDEMSRVIL